MVANTRMTSAHRGAIAGGRVFLLTECRRWARVNALPAGERMSSILQQMFGVRHPLTVRLKVDAFAAPFFGIVYGHHLQDL